jgi:hypothetical protein
MRLLKNRLAPVHIPGDGFTLNIVAIQRYLSVDKYMTAGSPSNRLTIGELTVFRSGMQNPAGSME